jgi:protein tyrosine/serine phosphatase
MCVVTMIIPTQARVRRCASAVLVAMAVASPVAAAPADGRSPAISSNATSPRIDNFGRVDGNLYRGAQPEGRDFADLSRLGVKTIVNLTSDDAVPTERAMVEAAGMKYVQIPMTTHTVPTAAQLAQFLGIVNDPASRPVYVHCVGGRHRTGVMTAAYRMTHDGWTAERAFEEMKQFKFGSDFLHPEFKQFVLQGYHPDVRPTEAVAAATATAVQR